MVDRAFSQISHSGPRAGLASKRRESMLPVDAHPCSAPADSALHRLTEASTAICIAYMVAAPS